MLTTESMLFFNKEVEEHYKEAIYGGLIDAFDRGTLKLMNKAVHSKNPLVGTAGAKAVGTAAEMHNPQTKNVLARGARSAMNTVDNINNSRGAAVITGDPLMFIGDSLQGGAFRAGAKKAVKGAQNLISEDGLVAKALDTYGYGVENLPSQVPWLTGPAQAIGQAVGAYFGKTAEDQTALSFLTKARRDGFIDPRDDDFAKNQAFGRAAGAGLLASIPGNVLGAHLASRAGKGVGTTALASVIGGGTTAALPAAMVYNRKLDEFRELQKKGRNPALNKPFNIERIERLKKQAKKRKGLRLKKEASSSARVKSPHSYYQPQVTTAEPAPLGTMNRGNSEKLNQQAAMLLADNRAKSMATAPPPAPPASVQPNTPMVQPPFKPKYTGM